MSREKAKRTDSLMDTYKSNKKWKAAGRDAY